MKIRLRADNLLLLTYAVLVSVYTSPMVNLRIFNSLLTIMFYFDVVIIVLGFLYLFMHEEIKTFFGVLFFALVTILICFMNGTHRRHLIILFSIIMGMYYTTSIKYSKDFYKILSIVGLFYNATSLLLSATYFDRWVNNPTELMNPNTVNIVNLFYAIVVNSYIYSFVKKESIEKPQFVSPATKKNSFWKRKIINLLLLIYNGAIVYILYSYKGRASQFSYLIFVSLLIFIKDSIIRKPKILTTIIGLMIVGGIVFPFLYISMPRNVMVWIETVTGKPYFSGREIIWSRFFHTLTDKTNLIIGPGSWKRNEIAEIWGDGRVYSMHNNYIDIMLCFGCVGIVGFLLFTLWRISKLSKQNKINNYVCLLGYMSFLILGYAENTFIYAFMVILFDLLLGMSMFNMQKQS